MKIRTSFNSFFGLIILLNCLVWANQAISQQNKVLDIPWEKPVEIYEGENAITIPQIKGQILDGKRPNFFWREEVTSSAITEIDLEIKGTSPANSQEIAFLNSQYIEIGEPEYTITISNAASERHAVLNMMPFMRVGNQIHRITQVEIKFSKGVPAQAWVQKDFAANSVLQSGSGVWIKIAVTEDGVHKIDRDFLDTRLTPLGININTVNPDHINIFGNGDGRLPELNSDPRTDDLAKNAIQIVGDADGSFDFGDYILFYAWGPNRTNVAGGELTQDRNTYSNTSCYFINVNTEATPLRVASIPNSSNSVTNSISTYSYFQKHETESVSLVKGGKRFYGEVFDTQLSQTFLMSAPNVDASTPASFKIFFATNANSGAGNTHSYSVNGVQMASSALPTLGSDYARGSETFQFPNPVASMGLQMTITRSSPSVLTYLDYIEMNARRGLVMTGNQFNFRDIPSVGTGNVGEFAITGLPASGFVWDVTDRHLPKLINGATVGSTYNFNADVDSLREFVASDGIVFKIPTFVSNVDPQDLHGLAQADYLIVTNKTFTAQADRLANLHRANGLTVHVVTSEQVYNEYSSGAQDATAIKMFAKMFYDRGALAPETRPKHLLMFGDGTFDHRNLVSNSNYLVTYQVDNSENHIAALVTDDYFGLLDDSESIGANDEMDIGVGRLLISSTEIAREQVDKIEHYMRNGSALYSTENTNCASDDGSTTFGDWRTKYVQVSDDEENGYFLNIDCEPAYDYLKANHPEINVDKIYLDAFQQVTTAGGARYPDVIDKINDRMERGALVMNYVGHGGEVGVAEERVITVPQIQGWKNIDRLTLMVSATCEFTKYDDPDRVSAGEWASLNPYGGAIALMTTTRSVFFGVNSATISEFIRRVFERDANNEPYTFGEIMRLTKNNSGSSNNRRSFTLIGDPALQIAMPKMNIVTDSINGLSPALVEDTLSALSKVTIKGHLEDFTGSVLNSFNGVVYPTVFDKIKMQQTLGNDPSSPVVDFELQNNKVYSGKASVTNGYFEFSFVVPKDINYSIGLGKLSYYAENGSIDAIGSDTRVKIGGIDPNGINDVVGPDIELYLNDENFVSGGISDETPILIAKIFDENGVNTVGNGIGHDLIAVLDEETGDPIVLNDYYVADLDSYQSGEIRYNFTELEPGPHTLSLKVWDVNNNSSETSIEFVVRAKENVELDHVLNYPNPFTTSTEFFFEHNQACVDLDAQIQIFTVSGRLVKTINESVLCDGFRSKGIHWNGLDDFGDQLAKGVYVYHVKVRTPEGEIAEKTEKLVILR
ncbi:MAG: type IX secretion system sortase PorU [Crocinitomicaceae bacterium]|nr:type IX secretion system sortase PorU [Crocinitomicaceae bacterium]